MTCAPGSMLGTGYVPSSNLKSNENKDIKQVNIQIYKSKL